MEDISIACRAPMFGGDVSHTSAPMMVRSVAVIVEDGESPSSGWNLSWLKAGRHEQDAEDARNDQSNRTQDPGCLRW
ncbi:hypothetical protein Aph01nite_41420 [Acrocarpospora phusangensis]|uniref:Uncharacterized protein n=1 Tax=Acrocarpospora phusangensis TaxID=1070424 RepID=A0A919UPL9_9ACTN|nr:hypothetical protein [Acrocarpospora phusangensis]GIH25832.1 hypothetical protein Aph01nite_41420 [Acrocarpospora phusangensis]